MFSKALLALFAIAVSASAADPTYWQDVRPILRKHCTVCHSERKLAEPELSAGLALDKPELVRKGGKAPVVVPGKPDESLLVTLLTSKDPRRAMPLDADPLPADAVAVLRKWVAAEAPEGVKPADDADAIVAIRAPTKLRKLPVAFTTKALVPKGRTAAGGPLGFTLPIGPLSPVAAVAFSPDGRLLAAGVYGRVTVWDLAAARPAKVLTNVLGAVNDLKFSPNGQFLAVAGGQPSARGDLRLFDAKTWKLVASLGGHLDVVSGVAFSPDGSKLASASFDKTVRLWDVAKPASPRLLHAFTGHSDFVYAVAFSPDAAWYATASKDRTSREVDAKTGQSRLTFSGTDQEVLAVAVRPDGAQVATGGVLTPMAWWDAKTGERLKRGTGPSIATHEIAFDARGTLAAAGGADKTVRLLDPANGNALRSLAAGAVVFAVAVDAPGKRVASGGADGLVELWAAADGRLLATLYSGAGSGDLGDWLAVASEGYYVGAEPLLAKAAWTAGGKPLADSKGLEALLDAAAVGKTLTGQAVKDAAVR